MDISTTCTRDILGCLCYEQVLNEYLGGNPDRASSAMLMTFCGIMGVTSSSWNSSSRSSHAESVSSSFSNALGRNYSENKAEFHIQFQNAILFKMNLFV